MIQRNSPLLFLFFFYGLRIVASSITPGPTGVFVQDAPLVLRNNEIVQGFVRLNNGFTIPDGGMATLDTFITVSGGIDLRDTGQLQLLSDLHLDAGVTLSSGGMIKGRGHSIVLHGDLTIPTNKTIKFIGDTIIEGNGGTLTLNPQAQFFVDNNITLTLRNLILKSTHLSALFPPLLPWGHTSKLALDNVILAPEGDLYFRQGQLFIHNDVMFTGTSKFIYQSSQSSLIASHSTLLFDAETTFSYDPSITYTYDVFTHSYTGPISQLKDHFVLSDQTSQLCLNSCTLGTTTTGMRLTRGRFVCDNMVAMGPSSWLVGGLANWYAATANFTTKAGDNIYSLKWNPTTMTYLLACGKDTSVGNNTVLRIYQFNGSSLTEKFTSSLNIRSGKFNNAAWNHAGNYVASVLQTNQALTTGALRVYSFNSSTGALLATQTTGNLYTTPNAVAWSPDDKYIAVADIAGTKKVDIYAFTNGTLNTTPVASISGISNINDIAWRPVDGRYLAVVGDDLRVYEFTGTSLNLISNVVNLGGTISSATWTSNGKMLAIGTSGSVTSGCELQLYEFSMNRLYLIDGVDLTGNSGAVSGIDTFWGDGGKFIVSALASPTSGNTLQLHEFSSGKLTLVNGRSVWLAGNLGTISWSHDNKYVAVGNKTSISGVNEIFVYEITAAQPSSNMDNGTTFGNNTLGSTYNLDVNILSDAQMQINGKVNYDPA